MKSQAFPATLMIHVSLAGCATNYEPAPPEFTGPSATIRDSGISEGLSKAQMFAVMEIDGESTMNAFRASAGASFGMGAALQTIYPERKVKLVPMKIKLRGSHATAAGFHALFSQMAGTFQSVEGVVDFEPKADVIYIVNGKLTPEKSSVWIEDGATGEPVTAIISK